MHKHWNKVIRYFVAVCLMGLPCTAVATKWRVSSGVGVSERYTDNYDLSATDKKISLLPLFLLILVCQVVVGGG